MSKNEIAISEFKSGLNCAQSVLSVFTDDLKIDRGLTLKIAIGFGAGMGRLQGTCGAVTGAFMAIGVFISKEYEEMADRKSKSIELVQAFNEKFIKIHKTTDCKDLIGCNLRTSEGQAYFKENNLSEKICWKCITDSVDILSDLFEKH